MSLRHYTADLHIGHEFVAQTRGFASAEQMDAQLVANWNANVRPRDSVWVLGDVTAGGFNDYHIDVLKQLNGTLHLVAGNHDKCHPLHRNGHTKIRRYMEVFETVQIAAEHRIDGHKVLLSHFPFSGDHTEGDRYEQWRLRDEGAFLLCGHVHAEWHFSYDGRVWNVGQDWHFEPVPEHAVKQWLAESLADSDEFQPVTEAS